MISWIVCLDVLFGKSVTRQSYFNAEGITQTTDRIKLICELHGSNHLSLMAALRSELLFRTLAILSVGGKN
jgi:hypothetical protein